MLDIDDLPTTSSDTRDFETSELPIEVPVDLVPAATLPISSTTHGSSTQHTESAIPEDVVKASQPDLPQNYVSVISEDYQPLSTPNSRGLGNPFSSSKLPSLISVPSFKPCWPFDSQHEARLFAHYIKEIAPWVNLYPVVGKIYADYHRSIPAIHCRTSSKKSPEGYTIIQ